MSTVAGRGKQLLAGVSLSFSVALAGCAPAPRHPEFSAGIPLYDCPDRLSGQVGLHVEVRPIEIAAAALYQPSIETTGAIGRQVLISIIPSGLRPDDSIVWSSLTIASYGGTFLGWDRLRTGMRAEGVELAGEARATRQERADEISLVTFSPGQLKVLRSARGNKDLAGVVAIDVLVMPGGTTVEDAVVNIPQLWRDDGAPLAGEELAPQLVPVRHPPGLDVVQGTFELSFVVREASTGDEWSCAAEERATFVDQGSLRQPFWDLGLAAPNSARGEWLALFDPALGAVRLVFDNPASAHSLASWLRATGSTQVGRFSLTAFSQSKHPTTKPFGPTSEQAMQTLRPVKAEDLKAISVGPAGEP